MRAVSDKSEFKEENDDPFAGFGPPRKGKSRPSLWDLQDGSSTGKDLELEGQSEKPQSFISAHPTSELEELFSDFVPALKRSELSRTLEGSSGSGTAVEKARPSLKDLQDGNFVGVLPASEAFNPGQGITHFVFYCCFWKFFFQKEILHSNGGATESNLERESVRGHPFISFSFF